MKKGGERLTVGYDLELERAIENSELYWRKCEPLNDLRLREGIPIVTKAELLAKKAIQQKPYLAKKS